jgi:3',5'-cyclic AMP phosphodiesterase CpdA
VGVSNAELRNRGAASRATAPVLRVLHFSDVHVQLPVLSAPVPELLGKRLLAGLNLWLARGALFADVSTKLDTLADFVAEQSIALAICSGDFTAMGTPGEHREARRQLERLAAAAELGLCVVPGNHDLYLPDTLRDARFETNFGELMRSDLSEYAVDGPFPFVRLVGTQLAVIGINSARPNPNPFSSAGFVPRSQLAALARLFDDPRLAGRRLLVMTHYGILRPDGSPDARRHGLENAQELLAVCARPGLMLVHGHIHHRYCHPAAPGRPWLFCAGSATHRGREGFWLYEFEGGRARAIPGAFQAGQYVALEHQAVSLW